jgi:PAS domain S-box-containing protein
MDADRNMLFGALALQTGLIDGRQFNDACKPASGKVEEPVEDILLRRGWISQADTPHLDYLVRRVLQKHQGDPKATLVALPSALRESLSALRDLDFECTVAGLPSGQLIAPTDLPGLDSRYGELKFHAEGGIGRVWRARDRHLDREVALKELHPEQAENANVAARFLREARLTGQLEHPGIVPVYELASRGDGNQPFYTMRLVRGRTLTRAIDTYYAKRALGEAQPLDFVGLLAAFVAICNTIAYSHSRGVVHRDLKGDNVILGDFGEVIVLDWGLAKVVGQSEEPEVPSTGEPAEERSAGLTMQGEVVGTPAFMAPEQAEGRLERIDHRTDVYGLGAILYEILSGQPPFTGKNTVEVLRKAAQGNPQPPHEIRPDVPPALEAACLKAMAKDPEQRYASAAELGQEVQRWQDVQRRQAEDALRRQTEILSSVLNGMSAGVLGADRDGKLLIINPAAERMIGRPAEATLASARSTIEFFRSDKTTPIEPDDTPLMHAIHGEQMNDTEMLLRNVVTGEETWTSVNGRPLRDESGNMSGGVVVFHDITERKRAEEERDRLLVREREARAEAEAAVRVLEEAREALRASEAQYRSLADLIPGIVWTARPDGWIDYANQFWFTFTGLTMEQTQGSGWGSTIHPDDFPKVSELWTKALQTGEPIEVDYRVKRKSDGAYRWFLAQGRPVRDREGRVIKWFGMLTEIEDQKQSEKALQRQYMMVNLLHRVTVAAYEAATVDQALKAVIDQVCAHTGWPVGHVLVLASDGSRELVSAKIWRLDRSEAAEGFVRETEATRFTAGVGLPGRVLAAKQPCWIMDVSSDKNFPRTAAAAKLGIKGAFAFPVLASAGVVAVMEFFATQPKEPDEVLLEALAQIGIQLGQVFDRKRAEGELRAAKEAVQRANNADGRSKSEEAKAGARRAP